MKTIKNVIDYLGEVWGAIGWALLLAGVWVALSLERASTV